jgi:hypothetical protein
MRNLIQWVLKGIVIAVVFIPITSMAQENKAAAAIEQIMKENPVMGMSVAVIKNSLQPIIWYKRRRNEYAT